MSEGVRCIILMTFHPSVTDVVGSLHLMRHFWTILGSKLNQEDVLDGTENGAEVGEESLRSIEVPLPHEDQQQHLSIENILQVWRIVHINYIQSNYYYNWRSLKYCIRH